MPEKTAVRMPPTTLSGVQFNRHPIGHRHSITVYGFDRSLDG